MILIEQSEQEICKCRQFFSPDAAADIIHATACLHARAILISNDAHFKGISEAGIIEVWTIAEAIERLLDSSVSLNCFNTGDQKENYSISARALNESLNLDELSIVELPL